MVSIAQEGGNLVMRDEQGNVLGSRTYDVTEFGIITALVAANAGRFVRIKWFTNGPNRPIPRPPGSP